jgi:hypothetical protein
MASYIARLLVVLVPVVASMQPLAACECQTVCSPSISDAVAPVHGLFKNDAPVQTYCQVDSSACSAPSAVSVLLAGQKALFIPCETNLKLRSDVNPTYRVRDTLTLEWNDAQSTQFKRVDIYLVPQITQSLVPVLLHAGEF